MPVFLVFSGKCPPDDAELSDPDLVISFETIDHATAAQRYASVTDGDGQRLFVAEDVRPKQLAWRCFLSARRVRYEVSRLPWLDAILNVEHDE